MTLVTCFSFAIGRLAGTRLHRVGLLANRESQLSGCKMANVTLQSFNVFLTERLTAAAVDIYGFVEKTIIDYQEEVYQTKLENQRLQRLLDLVYKPEIRLHRAGMFLS